MVITVNIRGERLQIRPMSTTLIVVSPILRLSKTCLAFLFFSPILTFRVPSICSISKMKSWHSSCQWATSLLKE